MKYNKIILSILISLLFGHVIFGQSLDRNIYLNLVDADSSEFIKYTQNLGYDISYDSTSKLLMASTKGFTFAKPLGEKGNLSYALTLIVATKDKENNKIIIQKAKPVKQHKQNTWADKKYIYIVSEIQNSSPKETWYKVMIYRKK